MQRIDIVARTFENSKIADRTGITVEELNKEMNSDLTIIAGKAAGVCYMPDNYFEDGIQNEEKAIERAENTSKSGHHSVYDHGHITMVIHTNKMMAMILNSLGVYTTSEKSARYTKMKPETELELQLYEKWKEKLQQLILERYPDIDDDMINKRLRKAANIIDDKFIIVKNGKLQVNNIRCIDDMLETQKKSETLPSYKLAQENARYMISVFTPTTMEYTVSFRQLCLIENYLYRLSVCCQNASDTFSKKLFEYVNELWKEFDRIIGENRIRDNKNQCIRFLEAQNIGEFNNKNGLNTFIKYDDLDERLEAKQPRFGDSYTAVYYGSLAMLAQAQRHRTLRYTMLLREPGEYNYYVPRIIRDAGTECISEWLSDISSVAYCIPQGTIVRITEQGLFEDFALKCKERLCGRAQLEIMESTTATLRLMIDEAAYKNELSYSNKKLLESMTELCGKTYKICPRCKFKDFKCSEGCNFGALNALSRLI